MVLTGNGGAEFGSRLSLYCACLAFFMKCSVIYARAFVWCASVTRACIFVAVCASCRPLSEFLVRARSLDAGQPGTPSKTRFCVTETGSGPNYSIQEYQGSTAENISNFSRRYGRGQCVTSCGGGGGGGSGFADCDFQEILNMMKEGTIRRTRGRREQLERAAFPSHSKRTKTFAKQRSVKEAPGGRGRMYV